MSSALVGPVQDVPGARLINASQPGAVLAVLRNGKVLKVIDPGKRVGRYFRGRTPGRDPGPWSRDWHKPGTADQVRIS